MTTILRIVADSSFVVVFPTDMVLILNEKLRHRLIRGWIRRRLIRRYGPFGPSTVRWLLWGMTAVPGLPLLLINEAAGLVFISLYWILLGLANLIDYLTSWDDPPWKRATK